MDKFYIIGTRYNPQLGCYLSKAIIAKPKVNKRSITAKFTEYGSESSLKFSKEPYSNGEHGCISTTECVYGSYSYKGYSSKEAAIAELKTWLDVPGSSAERAKTAIAAFEAA